MTQQTPFNWNPDPAPPRLPGIQVWGFGFPTIVRPDPMFFEPSDRFKKNFAARINVSLAEEKIKMAMSDSEKASTFYNELKQVNADIAQISARSQEELLEFFIKKLTAGESPESIMEVARRVLSDGRAAKPAIWIDETRELTPEQTSKLVESLDSFKNGSVMIIPDNTEMTVEYPARVPLGVRARVYSGNDKSSGFGKPVVTYATPSAETRKYLQSNGMNVDTGVQYDPASVNWVIQQRDKDLPTTKDGSTTIFRTGNPAIDDYARLGETQTMDAAPDKPRYSSMQLPSSDAFGEALGGMVMDAVINDSVKVETKYKDRQMEIQDPNTGKWVQVPGFITANYNRSADVIDKTDPKGGTGYLRGVASASADIKVTPEGQAEIMKMLTPSNIFAKEKYRADFVCEKCGILHDFKDRQICCICACGQVNWNDGYISEIMGPPMPDTDYLDTNIKNYRWVLMATAQTDVFGADDKYSDVYIMPRFMGGDSTKNFGYITCLDAEFELRPFNDVDVRFADEFVGASIAPFRYKELTNFRFVMLSPAHPCVSFPWDGRNEYNPAKPVYSNTFGMDTLDTVAYTMSYIYNYEQCEMLRAKAFVVNKDWEQTLNNVEAADGDVSLFPRVSQLQDGLRNTAQSVNPSDKLNKFGENWEQEWDRKNPQY